MKTKLLRRLRRKVWSECEIRKRGIWLGQGGPWVIVYSALDPPPFYGYATEKEAIEAAKMLWHKEAERYLWKNKAKRKRNKYPW